jgi:hypothetical protein
VDIRKVGQPAQRFRINLTDSVQQIPAMIATQNNELLINGTVVVNSLLRLEEFTYNNLNGTPILILLSFTVVGTADALPAPPVSSSGSDHSKSASTPQNHYNTGSTPVYPSSNSYASAAAPSVYNQSSAAPSPYSGGSGAYGGYGGSSNSKPVSRLDTDSAVMPISSLNPYSNR